MIRRALMAAFLLAGCTSVPPSTPALSRVTPTIAPTRTPQVTTPVASPPFDVACGPLDAALCDSAVAVVEGQIAMLRAEAPDLAPVRDVNIEPPTAFMTCPPDQDPCSVIAFITFAEPGPFAIGLVRSGQDWVWEGEGHGWWGTDGTSYCIPPAFYRLDGKVSAIGPCFTGLYEPSGVTITLAVGQTLEIHMTTLHSIPPQSRPFYPLPWSTSPNVLSIEAAADAATATYSALTPGVATLLTIGNCIPNADTPTGIGDEFFGHCPLATVRVTSSK